MSKLTNTRTIDGLEFEIRKLKPTDSLPAQYRLFRVFGPAMARMVGESKAIKSIEELDVTALGPALAMLFGASSEEDVVWARKTLLAGARVKGAVTRDTWVDLLEFYDLVFEDKPFTPWKVLRLAVEVNFGNFFAELGAKKAASPTPNSKG